MRLNINLATQPYQDVRRFLLRWGIAVAALAVITIALTWIATTTVISWRKTTRQARYYRSEIEKCDREHAAAQALLDRPENRATKEKSRFINTLIARKAFSWTAVLTDLEGILPSGIHIVGIAPSINDNNELVLKLTAAGPSRERAVELVSNMENSKHFRNAYIRNDVFDQSPGDPRQQTGPNYRFEIEANYVPPYQQLEKAETASVIAKQEGR